MLRRAADDTRRLLLATGVQMLHERGVTAGVTHIRLQDVVRRADLTTGAAYRLWADQEAFHRDLAVAGTRWRDEMPISRTIGAIRRLVDERAPLVDVIRVAAAAHVDSFGEPVAAAGRSGEAFLTTLALRATAQHDADLRAASSARHCESLDSFTELYTTLMEVYGRRVRRPLTVRQFAITLAALGEGFALQAIEGEAHPVIALDPDGRGEPQQWTLFGAAVNALVNAFTEPVLAGPSSAPEEK